MGARGELERVVGVWSVGWSMDDGVDLASKTKPFLSRVQVLPLISPLYLIHCIINTKLAYYPYSVYIHLVSSLPAASAKRTRCQRTRCLALPSTAPSLRPIGPGKQKKKREEASGPAPVSQEVREAPSRADPRSPGSRRRKTSVLSALWFAIALTRSSSMPAPAPFSSTHNQPLFPALYLYPLNNSFVPKHITLLHNQRVKIGRQTNVQTVPAEWNGYFDSQVLSRQHAEVWEDANKVC